MAPGWIGRSGRARRWAGNRVYEGGGVRCNSWVVFAPWKSLTRGAGTEFGILMLRMP
ncbi:unnamed protein product [Musa acuminata subsp. malaccensis]|uniref:(wild Malaysian banana) hypothetical protein n=1 Tax=Musa acuminata subsp. malaccensis TaxID=214687 RepID=A0A804L0G5_MUSAM|nr:unnamed protein product [Musa acuminata subsp. malaccensis]